MELGWLKAYDLESLKKDSVSALTVAFVALPQSMAYALIAGVQPEYGLYAFVVGSIFGALLGSSRHLQTGPTNASSVVVASTLAAYVSHDHFMGLVFLLGALSGFYQLAAGLLKLGKLTQFISRSVLVGFIAGAALLIVFNQAPNLLGIPRRSDASVVQGAHNILQNLNEINPVVLALGLGTMLLALLLQRLSPRSASGLPIIPAYLIAILAAALTVMLLGLDRNGVAIVGTIPATLPPLSVPAFSLELLRDLSPGALALALIGLAEAISAAKSVASQSGDQVDVDREFVGQGVTKIITAFFSGIPVSGSLTRTQLCFSSGAVTKMANVLAGVVMIAILLVASPLARYIPLASLAGIVMLIAASMIDWQYARLALRATRSDAVAMGATFVAALIFKLDTAIFIGVGISLILFLRKAQIPRLSELVYEEEAGGFQELKDPQKRPVPEISIVHVEGDVFFGAAEFLEQEIARIVRRPEMKVLILRVKRACCLDATSLASLGKLYEQMQERGQKLIVSGVTGEVERVFRRAGMVEKIGPENIFFSDTRILGSTRDALTRAMEHVRLTDREKYRVRLFYDVPSRTELENGEVQPDQEAVGKPPEPGRKK